MRIKMWILISCTFIFVEKSKSQYLLIPKNSDSVSVLSEKILIGNLANSKIYNVNYQSNLYSDKYLIHVIVFSDSNGNFKNRSLSRDSLKNKSITLNELFTIAVQNINKDENREILSLDYEASYIDYPINTDLYKIVTAESDSSFILHDNYTITFFYEIRPFKQITVIQSCASLINTQSILQPVKRILDNNGILIVDRFDFSDTLGDYFPNKLFLEKRNSDSSYHFVKFQELCMDCQPSSYEFDYDKKLGIIRFWHYLPWMISKKWFGKKNRLFIKYK